MEWIIILALGFWLYTMGGRLKRLERRVEELRWQTPVAELDAPTPPVSARASVPRTAPEAIAKLSAELAPERPLIQPQAAPEQLSEPLAPPSRSYWANNAAPAPEPDQPPTKPTTSPTVPKFDFEDIFGRRLPIWAGGVALAVAGVFLVRYSIENGLMTPPVRVALSFVFGVLLLAVAEAAHRFEKWVADPRVRQALAGAGLATLYAAFYLAGALYGLIGPAAAFAGLAGVTALAIGLTFRFGLPAAVLGLIGGFATPLLVASESANVPVLTFYLALTTAGLALTGRRIGQPWLSFAALAAGFGWGALLLVSNLAGDFNFAALGLYLLALGVGVPLLAAGHGSWSFARIGAGSIAALQLAYLVDLGGYDTLTLGLFLLLGGALAALAWREEALRPGNALVAALGVVLLAIWPEPPVMRYTLTAAALALIVLGVPLALLWRGKAKWPDLAQLALAAPAIAMAAAWQFGIADNEVFQPALAAACAVLGMFPALAAWRLWPKNAGHEKLAPLLAVPVGVAALLGFAALNLVLPDWAEVVGAAAVALVLAGLAWKRRETELIGLAWAGAVGTLLVLLGANPVLEELSQLIGAPSANPDLLSAIIRWAVAGLPLLALALLNAPARPTRAAEALFAFTLYGLIAQVIPGDWLAWSAAILAMTCMWWQRERRGFAGAMLVFAGLWGLTVFGFWAVAGIQALGGDPMMVGNSDSFVNLPGWRETLRHLLPVTAALALAAWLARGKGRPGTVLAVAAGGAALVVVHLLYKLVFALETPEQFAALGMAERTIWQALLIGAGIALARVPRLRDNAVATGLVAVGLTHFAWFTLVLHNPLWSAQAVGALPVANWLLPAYALAGGAVVWLSAQAPAMLREKLRVLADAVLMGLITLFALSTLRHAFSGSLLTAIPMSQNEDLLRSLLGIVLAIGFLLWGSRREQRSWRIGSLVLMLAAVLKVFLVDAAGLEGLLRIASFLALGFSLIGIGWVYSRQLAHRKSDPRKV